MSDESLAQQGDLDTDYSDDLEGDASPSVDDLGSNPDSAATDVDGSDQDTHDELTNTDSGEEIESDLAGEDSDKHDWKKRYADVQRYAQREREERSRFEREAREHREALEKMKSEFEERKRVETSPPWIPTSPKHDSFRKVLDKAEYLGDLLKDADDDERPILQARINRSFSEEEQRMLVEYQRHQAETQRRMVTDPAFFREQMREEMRLFYEEQSRTAEQERNIEQVKHDVRAKLSEPENMQIIGRHKDKWLAGLNEGKHPFDLLENLRLQDQIESLRKKTVSGAAVEADASAIRQAAKGKARVSRDLSGSKRMTYNEIVAAAQEAGLAPGSKAYNEFVFKKSTAK